MNADGTGQTRLTNNAAATTTPGLVARRPKIAFVSEPRRQLEIYTMNADGTGQTRLTNDRGDRQRPAWGS